MKNNLEKTSQRDMPLIEEEEQDQLIQENFTEEEIEDLIKEGFTKEQIAYVAKENSKGDKQFRILGRTMNIIFDIVAWVFPGFPK